MDQITAQRRFTAIFFTAFPRLGNDQAEKRMTADEEMRVLMLMQAIRRNETLWRWLYDEEKGNFSERHMLQLLGWLYDRQAIKDFSLKSSLARYLMAEKVLADMLSISSLQTYLSMTPVAQICDCLKCLYEKCQN